MASDMAEPSHRTDSVFHGTAWYYSRFRPQYPDALFDYLVEKFEPEGNSSLLDVGCGTGQISIPFAPHFERVFAMDPDPDMLKEGQQVAEERAVRNIQWIHGGSDQLETIRPTLQNLRLVVMASSFHWMDRTAVLEILHSMLNCGGGIAITGYPSLWNLDGDWQHAVRSVIQRWLGTRRRAGADHYQEPEERHETIVSRSPFRHLEQMELKVERTWTADGIMGHLLSTSFCSPRVLGEKRTAFERDLRRTLEALRPDGLFEEASELQVITAFK